VVVVFNFLMLKVIDDVDIANNIALGVFRSLVNHRHHLFIHPSFGITSSAPLLADNSTFSFNFIGFKRDES